MRIITEIRNTLQYFNAFDFNATNEDLAPYAASAYCLCVGWFGSPSDPHRQYEIVSGPYGVCYFDSLVCRYGIGIPRHYESLEQRCATLAHEMYHRVTMRRSGLRRQVWVDEIMAFLAAQHILCELGFGDHAKARVRNHRAYARNHKILSVEELRASRRKWILTKSGDSFYPEGFGTGVALVGLTLESLVGWKQMCRIVGCQTWEERLRPMPSDLQRVVRAVLRPALS